MESFDQALKYANDFSIQHSGITHDNAIVTTLECVQYQLKRGNLKLHIDGNWEYVKTGMCSGGWRQNKLKITYYEPKTN
jgi:hypothetical protein